MNVEKNLMNLGIVQTRKFEFKETNFVAKTVAEKLADNVLELSLIHISEPTRPP